VAEWLMAPVLKTGVLERVSGVRIPPLPPFRLLCSTSEGDIGEIAKNRAIVAGLQASQNWRSS
jgi:hypothetical protein